MKIVIIAIIIECLLCVKHYFKCFTCFISVYMYILYICIYSIYYLLYIFYITIYYICDIYSILLLYISICIIYYYNYYNFPITTCAWGNWRTKKFSNLFKVTQLVNSITRIWMLGPDIVVKLLFLRKWEEFGLSWVKLFCSWEGRVENWKKGDNKGGSKMISVLRNQRSQMVCGLPRRKKLRL